MHINASFRSALATGCAVGVMAIAVPAHAQDPETVTPVEESIVEEDPGVILVTGSRINPWGGAAASSLRR